MKGQTYLVLSIIFIILISVFAVLNVNAVEVNFLFWSGTTPLIFIILFSVLLGSVFTLLVGSTKYVSLKREIKKLHKENNLLQKEVNKDEVVLQPERNELEETTKKDRL